MCRIITEDELCEGPNFCVVCLSTRADVDKNHVCMDCQASKMKTQDEFIKIVCPVCDKVLFEGTKAQARRLIIYCTKCT